MTIAAYGRVSTNKEDQLNSLDAQKDFFTKYVAMTGHHLVRLYADEGISGTKVKNRTEFLRMMADAELGQFEMLVVKDISRFARVNSFSRSSGLWHRKKVPTSPSGSNLASSSMQKTAVFQISSMVMTKPVEITST